MADLIADPGTEVEEVIRESSAHLARSLDLLSRLLHPPPATDIGPISVREPLDFMAEVHRAGRPRARLELEIDHALPAAAGIERHLEHALLNLLISATDVLQAQEAGVIRITARKAGDNVEIAVADNRVGVGPDDRVSSDGFVVATEVIRLSGGTLTSDPGPQHGARFLITLPTWRRAPHPEE
jgi:C4-dicarboxylate-specific signal transduction histidine kinase